MTAKERLVKAASYPAHPEATAAWLKRFLAHPDVLLAVLVEVGVLIEEHSPRGNYPINRGALGPGWLVDENQTRFVSPWVPSGDQA